MDAADVAAGIRWQADHCAANGAPCTARIVRAQLALLDGTTKVGARLRDWPGKVLEDALPLRLAGGIHHLVLSGSDLRPVPVYREEVTAQEKVDSLLLAMVRDHDERLLPWLDGPPQTNEAGRSAAIMAALLWLSRRTGPRFELNEIGASAGVNTMMDRFFFDLGGTTAGPADSPMRIVPEWRGPPPPVRRVEIVGITGCDRAPVNLSDADEALRLKSYVWPEVSERIGRIDAAIALAAQRPPRVDRAGAASWVEARLAMDQPGDTTRVLFHSIVWQYLAPEDRVRIESAMGRAGAAADSTRRLAWIALETNRATFRHEVHVRYWPGGETAVLLGSAHAHGAWVEWNGLA